MFSQLNVHDQGAADLDFGTMRENSVLAKAKLSVGFLEDSCWPTKPFAAADTPDAVRIIPFSAGERSSSPMATTPSSVIALWASRYPDAAAMSASPSSGWRRSGAMEVAPCAFRAAATRRMSGLNARADEAESAKRATKNVVRQRRDMFLFWFQYCLLQYFDTTIERILSVRCLNISVRYCTMIGKV